MALTYVTNKIQSEVQKLSKDFNDYYISHLILTKVLANYEKKNWLDVYLIII